jgi:hypothetical protein
MHDQRDFRTGAEFAKQEGIALRAWRLDALQYFF